jgi:monovalent cation/hydrogen antiporter
MATVELVIMLIPIAAGIHLLAGWLKIPSPTLLVVGGLALAFVPGLPKLDVPPNLIFVLFVPPLLYYGAITAPWREFRLRVRPIISLSVFLVLVTMAVVAAVVHRLSPEFTWAAAFALGAIVSPPDPVAAVAVTRPLNVARSIEGILQGEGLANDATALVAYSVAVTAAVTGTFSPARAAVHLVVAAAGGIAIGLAIGAGTNWLYRICARSPLVQNAISLIVPFTTYVAADRLDTSGVLAVVAAGLMVGRHGSPALTAEVRIQFESLWTLINFVLESLIFIFIGLELPVVTRGLSHDTLHALVGLAAIVSVVCIVVRILWGFPSAYFTRRRDRAQFGAAKIWRQVAFIAWAGMRGADSLVIALALPTMTRFGEPFPARAPIIVITFGVILATLVVQGATVGPVARLLHLPGASVAQEQHEEATAWTAVADSAIAELSRAADTPLGKTRRGRRAIARLLGEYRALRQDWLMRRDAAGQWDRPQGEVEDERQMELAVLDQARDTVRDLRNRGTIDDGIAKHVERYLDLETMLQNYPTLDVTESPFDVTE